MSFVSIPSILQQSPASTRPNSRQDSRVIGVFGHDGFSSTIELLERNQLPKLPTPDYKPLPLRWPFLALLFFFLLGLAGLAEYVARAFPPGLDHYQDPVHDTWAHVDEKAASHGGRNRQGSLPATTVVVNNLNHSSFPRNLERPRTQLDLPTSTVSKTNDNLARGIAVTQVVHVPHPPTGSYFQPPTTLYPTWQTIAHDQNSPDDTWELGPDDASRGKCLYIHLNLVWAFDPALSIGSCRMIITPSDYNYPGSFGGTVGQAINTCDDGPPPYLFSVTDAQYLIGLFLPVLLTTLLTIPISILNANIKMLLPFHMLAQAGASNTGVSARDSLCMTPFNLLPSIWTGLRLACSQHRELVPLLGNILVLLSALVVPLSAASIGLNSACENSLWHYPQGEEIHSMCRVRLGFDEGATRVLEALIIAMAFCVLCVGVLLARWRSGIRFPGRAWSMGYVAGLLQNERTQEVLRSVVVSPGAAGEEVRRQLGGYLFALRHYRGRRGGVEYGLVVVEDGSRLRPGSSGSSFVAGEEPDTQRRDGDTVPQARSPHGIVSEISSRQHSGVTITQPGNSERNPVFKDQTPNMTSSSHEAPNNADTDEVIINVTVLLLLIGLLVIIIYYDTTEHDTGFERFMDSQSFLVKYLFAGAGVIISFFWEYAFSRIATLTPYRQLSTPNLPGRQNPTNALPLLLIPRATNPFTGLLRALSTRTPSHTPKPDILTASIALAAVLSKGTPILLALVPFSPLQTWRAHEICTWTAVAVLGYMVLLHGAVTMGFMLSLPKPN
ncbi:hypothetical protein B0T19DRAFT_455704 [Cercophora scortea]|uniref:Uncharacterized protein n=1 Tax=Cercophora scortea TaxID=314031 RepID=A0AAE0MNN9_9PEZI|nr:hypothetical protein B0T19DRAFT_455704 [Cercophora scortea]